MKGGRERIHEVVMSALVERTRQNGLAGDGLSDDTDILGSGLIDSLAFVDLLMLVEAELGAPLALEQLDLERIDSLRALVDALHELAVAS